MMIMAIMMMGDDQDMGQDPAEAAKVSVLLGVCTCTVCRECTHVHAYTEAVGTMQSQSQLGGGGVRSEVT